MENESHQIVREKRKKCEREKCSEWYQLSEFWVHRIVEMMLPNCCYPFHMKCVRNQSKVQFGTLLGLSTHVIDFDVKKPFRLFPDQVFYFNFVLSRIRTVIVQLLYKNEKKCCLAHEKKCSVIEWVGMKLCTFIFVRCTLEIFNYWKWFVLGCEVSTRRSTVKMCESEETAPKTVQRWKNHMKNNIMYWIICVNIEWKTEKRRKPVFQLSVDLSYFFSLLRGLRAYGRQWHNENLKQSVIGKHVVCVLFLVYFFLFSSSRYRSQTLDSKSAG